MNKKIKDIAIIEKLWEDGQLNVLNENDHLLRRFGSINLREYSKDVSSPEKTNEVVDEIWTLIAGGGVLRLADYREGSPSLNEVDEILLDENSIQSVLIPFGIIFSFSAKQDSKVIVIRTHQED